MTIQIIARHMVGGQRHEHIAEVKWNNPGSGQTGSSSRDQMVDWLGNPVNSAYVSDGRNIAYVRVVNARPPYIQTYADGKWTDNLLALPTY